MRRLRQRQSADYGERSFRSLGEIGRNELLILAAGPDDSTGAFWRVLRVIGSPGGTVAYYSRIIQTAKSRRMGDGGRHLLGHAEVASPNCDAGVERTSQRHITRVSGQSCSHSVGHVRVADSCHRIREAKSAPGSG